MARQTVVRRQLQRRMRVLACGTITGLLAGCSMRFHEQYYVGVYSKAASGTVTSASQTSGEDKDKPVQFYRFDLDGWSSYFCDTKFASGWYDAQAVERLFGEVGTPTQPAVNKQPPAIAGKTSAIPIISSTGTFNNSSGGLITLKNVLIQPRTGNKSPAEATGQMMNYSSLSNCTVAVTLDANWQISGMQITSHCDASLPATATQTIFSQQYCDITPDLPSSEANIKNAQQVIVRGGKLDMEVSNATLTGQSWNGANTQTVSSSPYHDFSLGGGTFQLIGDHVIGSSYHLQSNGAIGIFQAANASKGVEIAARSGYLLELTDATLNTTGGALTAHLVVDQQSPAFVLVFGDRSTWNNAIKAMPDFKNWQGSNQHTGTFTNFNISGANFGVMSVDPGSFNTANASSAALIATPQFTHETWSAPSMQVSAGTWTISTTTAVENAIMDGQQVVLQTDSNHRQYLVFGPEGVSTASPADQRFVIFMSSDPKPLTDRIRAMVNSQQTQQAISAAMFGPLLNQQTKTVNNAASSLSTAKKYATDLETALANFNTSAGNTSAGVFQSLVKNWSSNAGEGQ